MTSSLFPFAGLPSATELEQRHSLSATIFECVVLRCAALSRAALIATKGVWITTGSWPNSQSKRPSLCLIHSGHGFLKSACVPREFAHLPETSWKDKPTNQRTPRTEGLAQTCLAILHCHTGQRGLKSMTEEFGGGEGGRGGRSSPQVGVPHFLS